MEFNRGTSKGSCILCIERLVYHMQFNHGICKSLIPGTFKSLIPWQLAPAYLVCVHSFTQNCHHGSFMSLSYPIFALRFLPHRMHVCFNAWVLVISLSKQVMESKRLIKCFLNYLRHDHTEVGALFDVLSIFLYRNHIDYSFLKEFYVIEAMPFLVSNLWESFYVFIDYFTYHLYMFL
jgi:hypothetical protein